MAKPGWPERNRATRSFRQLRRFDHVINSDKVFGTHRETRHRAFHFAVFSGYDSPTTIGLYENVYERFDRYRRLGVAKKGSLAGVIDDHSKLIDLVRISDVDAGCVLIKRHVDDVVEIVRQNANWT